MSEGAIQEMPRGVTIICYRNGRFAVSRRTGTHGRGLWQFPGGHVEPGEAVHDAALRELREETGLVIERHRLVTLGIVGPLTGYNGKPYLGFRFGVELRDDEVLEHKEPEKHTPWEWRRPAEVANLDMLRATKEYAYQFALQCLGF